MNAPDRYLTWCWEDEDDEITQKLGYEADSKRPNAGTFILRKEDHTLGNLLRTQLLRDPGVRFAGYRMPHPLIFDTHVRVESMDSKLTPQNIFESALADLQLEVEIIKNTFDSAIAEFEQNEF